MRRFAFLDRHGRLVAWGLAALYVAVFFPVCLTKLRYYLYTDFDLALFTQAAHEILRGSLWNSIRGMHWIGDHSSLVLFLLAPVQAVAPGPASMLFAQTALLAVGAVAAWRLARHEGLAEPAPVLCAAFYLLHPAIGYSNLFEFHPEVLSTSALLFTFLAVRTGSRRALVAWAALALLGKEDVALPVFMMGLYTLTLRRAGKKTDAALLVGLAVLSLAVSFAWLKPAFNQGDVDYGDMYRHLGNTTGERVLHLVLQPAEVLAALVSSPGDPVGSAIKWNYYLQVLGPLAFVPLASPLVLLVALPTLAEHMLSDRWPQHTIVFQYTAYITPVVVAAGILGLKQVARRWAARAARPAGRARSKGKAGPPAPVPAAAPPPGLAGAVAGAVALAGLLCQFAFGPFSAATQAEPSRPFEATRPDGRERALRPVRDRLVRRVPASGGVVASFLFMPRLATRSEVHSAHHVIRGRFTYSKRLYPIPEGVAAFIADMGDPALVPYQGPTSPDRMAEMFRLNGLHPADVAGDHVLFLRGVRDTVELLTTPVPAPTVPQAWAVDGEIEGAGFDSVETALPAGDELRLRTFWRRVGAARKIYLMDVVLVDTTGAIRARQLRPLGYGLSPVAEWPAGETVRETARWILPLDTPPGEYALAISLRARDGRVVEPPAPESAADPRLVPLGLVTVTAPGGARR